MTCHADEYPQAIEVHFVVHDYPKIDNKHAIFSI